ncbi:MAG: hypothetical protein D6705_15435 [Deltaproteobacteria bacterium]|nr:MAG: hypothetical protein D6705_15435 [Deltaproteobacteria bacterium]
MARALSRFLCVLAVMAALVGLAGGVGVDGGGTSAASPWIKDGDGAAEGVCGRDELVAETWIDCTADLHGSAVSDGEARGVCARYLAGIEHALGTADHGRILRSAWSEAPDAVIAQAPESGAAVVPANGAEGATPQRRPVRPCDGRVPVERAPSPPSPPPKVA